MKKTLNSSVKLTILLSLSLILIAQVAYLPMMLSVLLLTAIATLYIHFRQTELHAFSKLWTAFGVLAALASIYFSYGTFIGVEAGVAILTTFLFAKALEIKNTRDVIIIFNFALFVAASSFLFSQSIWMASIVLACLVSCFIGLYRLQTAGFQHQESITGGFKQDLKHVAKFIGLALPFFVLLFLFFPRLPPLWHIPIPENKAVTGMSDRMSPGDIAELSQSSALAFRILGDMSKLPPRSELYWRAMVLDHYDGQTWTSSPFNQHNYNSENQTRLVQHAKFTYRYLAADPQSSWVMGLDQSIPNNPQYFLKNDGSIMPNRAVQLNEPIDLQWLGKSTLADFVTEDPTTRKSTKKYPVHLDLRAQKLAQQLFEQAGRDPERYIHHVIDWYKHQHFAYTLQPGLLGQNRIDDFLFQSKQGFCEHYASSFALLMRYVRLPARIVVGYQGGDLAPDGKSWELRQLDAHAWTEVKLHGKWIRIDPTAIIAPQRIDSGMQNYMDAEQNVWGAERSNVSYQQYALLKRMRIWSDYASYQWQSKVVGYNAESQQNWLTHLGIRSTYAMVMVLALGVLALLAGYFLFIFYLKWKNTSEIDRLLWRFSKKLQHDLRKQESETITVWMHRLSDEIEVDDIHIFENIAHLHRKIMYAPKYSEQEMEQFAEMLKTCTLVLKNKRKILSK
ncbi:transglutaminase family protein [Acinetobacter tandoii]|jgi:transglutaminase-like putative cysteine protease|uniref:transglutaminase family protein n=1 Tax=Acinetobacter tandoii TaxID=202954 RepID=UPI0040466109